MMNDDDGSDGNGKKK